MVAQVQDEDVSPAGGSVLPVAEVDYGTATLSPCGAYRYDLTRRWGDGPLACWLMLNPSSADATDDDPTIRRSVGFSKSFECGGLVVVNLYALRATKPTALLTHPDPVGPENKQTIQTWLARAEVGVVVGAWGAWWKTQKERPPRLNVEELVRDSGHALQCLGFTKEGQPRHPLYVPASQPLMPYVRGTNHG